jgi:hypothetical protein
MMKSVIYSHCKNDDCLLACLHARSLAKIRDSHSSELFISVPHILFDDLDDGRCSSSLSNVQISRTLLGVTGVHLGPPLGLASPLSTRHGSPETSHMLASL